MRLALLILVAVVLGGLVISQFAVPPVAERQIADRLTAGGGSADVSVGAFPALRLLFGDGSRLEIDGRGLEIEIEGETRPLERLDGFDRVEVSIDDFAAGPFELESFELARTDPAPYRMRARGRAAPAEVVDYAADRLGIPGGGLLGTIAGQTLGGVPIPFTLDLELESDEGAMRVVSGGGTVAGIPAGPAAELIIAAIVERI